MNFKSLNESFDKRFSKPLVEADEPDYDLTKDFDQRGYDINDPEVKNYIGGANDYIRMMRHHADKSYSGDQWWKDTEMNYPDDLKGLRMKDGLCEAAESEDEIDARAEQFYTRYEKEHDCSLEPSTQGGKGGLFIYADDGSTYVTNFEETEEAIRNNDYDEFSELLSYADLFKGPEDDEDDDEDDVESENASGHPVYPEDKQVIKGDPKFAHVTKFDQQPEPNVLGAVFRLGQRVRVIRCNYPIAEKWFQTQSELGTVVNYGLFGKYNIRWKFSNYLVRFDSGRLENFDKDCLLPRSAPVGLTDDDVYSDSYIQTGSINDSSVVNFSVGDHVLVSRDIPAIVRGYNFFNKVVVTETFPSGKIKTRSEKPEYLVLDTSFKESFNRRRRKLGEATAVRERPMLSTKDGTISSALLANKDALDSADSKEELFNILTDVLSDFGADKAKEILSKASMMRSQIQLLQYIYNIILKGDNLGSLNTQPRRRPQYN